MNIELPSFIITCPFPLKNNQDALHLIAIPHVLQHTLNNEQFIFIQKEKEEISSCFFVIHTYKLINSIETLPLKWIRPIIIAINCTISEATLFYFCLQCCFGIKFLGISVELVAHFPEYNTSFFVVQSSLFVIESN